MKREREREIKRETLLTADRRPPSAMTIFGLLPVNVSVSQSTSKWRERKRERERNEERDFLSSIPFTKSFQIRFDKSSSQTCIWILTFFFQIISNNFWTRVWISIKFQSNFNQILTHWQVNHANNPLLSRVFLSVVLSWPASQCLCCIICSLQHTCAAIQPHTQSSLPQWHQQSIPLSRTDSSSLWFRTGLHGKSQADVAPPTNMGWVQKPVHTTHEAEQVH